MFPEDRGWQSIKHSRRLCFIGIPQERLQIKNSLVLGKVTDPGGLSVSGKQGHKGLRRMSTGRLGMAKIQWLPCNDWPVPFLPSSLNGQKQVKTAQRVPPEVTWCDHTSQQVSLLADIYQKETKIRAHTKPCTQMIIVALFKMVKKVQTTQHSRWLDNRNVVDPCNGILFSYKKEWNTDICYNVDELWKHHAKAKKSDIKGHVLAFCDSTYVKCSQQVNP